MKRYLILTLLLGAFCLSGCFSLDTADCVDSDGKHILVSNYGWRLFYAIPLCSGNANNDEARLGPLALFRDDVTMDKIQSRFMEEAARYEGEVSDLNYTVNETVLFTIPFVQVPIPIPYLICYREIQLSGVVK